jgi:hypothetical protein
MLERLSVLVRSLRFRLMLWNVGAVVLTGVCILLAVRAGVRYTLLKDLDEVLHEDLREIELHFQERPSLNWAELTEELNRKAEGHDFHHWFVQFYGPDGEPTWSSINTPELPAFTDEQRRQKAFSVMDYRASYQVLK